MEANRGSLSGPLALRPREAARALGVSPRTLWTWTHEGRVPHVKIGRAVLYPAAELQAWLSAQAITSIQTDGPKEGAS